MSNAKTLARQRKPVARNQKPAMPAGVSVPPSEEQAEATPKNHPHRKLIKECINFAVTLRGASGAFEADPTDADFVEEQYSRFLARARKSMEVISGCLPVTMDGLRAKAAAVIVAIEVDLERPDDPLARSLATDVIRFHRHQYGRETWSPTVDTAKAPPTN